MIELHDNIIVVAAGKKYPITRVHKIYGKKSARMKHYYIQLTIQLAS